MQDARKKAIEVIESEQWEGGLADLALGYGLRRRDTSSLGADSNILPNDIPSVVGLSSLDQTHQAIKLWCEANQGPSALDSVAHSEKRRALEDRVIELFCKSGWHDWSWGSP